MAVVRGGGHEVAKSAANARPAVCRRDGGRCAVRRSGREERVVAPRRLAGEASMIAAAKWAHFALKQRGPGVGL